MALPLTALQLDALREIANIGCGHAATALSQMLGGRRIEIDVPTAEVLAFSSVAGRVGGPHAGVVAVSLDMRGGTTGELQLVLPRDSARVLAGLLLGKEQPEGRLDAHAESAITEVGNILASAYLSAIGRAVGMTLIPSVPRFAEGEAGAVLGEPAARLGAEATQTLLIQTRFSERPSAGPSVRFFFGHFLVIPDPPSVPKLLGALGLG